VTLNTGFVDLESRHWCFVSAGHPWPVLIEDGVRVVKPNVGPPIGIGISSAWEPTHAALPLDSLILLYTDGLIENGTPAHPRDNNGDERLLAHLQRSALDIDDLLLTFGPNGFDDDVAIMTIAVD
jgi:serine phosphatase RsbU (regulator of sigma subunit)